LTSNLPFSRWAQVFEEATIASAMIDRIVRHADVIALTGASYRIKHTAIESLPSVEADRQADSTPVNSPAHFSTGRNCAGFNRNRQHRRHAEESSVSRSFDG
jgi:hypothetical protein